jgi:hypothetical protein
MDKTIIKNLEFMMDRNRISPYARARHLVIGMYIIWIIFDRHNLLALKAMHILAIYGLYIVMGTMIRETYVPELRNKRGFENILKEENRALRNGSLILLMFATITLIFGIKHSVPFFLCTLTWTYYQYLISLNWNGPVKNLLR